MRRKEKAIAETVEMEKVIAGSELCRLALSDDGEPYLVPMNFGYREGAVYFHSAPEGRKIDVIRKNPKVCVEFTSMHEMRKKGKACGWGTHYLSVIGFGTAEIVEDEAGKIDGLDALMSQYSGEKHEYDEKQVRRMVIIKVTLEKLTGKKSG